MKSELLFLSWEEIGRTPGPDGLPMAFFQVFRKIVKVDVMNFLLEFHDRTVLSLESGATFIALIPNKSGAVNIKDFRPINLIETAYKILDKVLVGRIKSVMPRII